MSSKRTTKSYEQEFKAQVVKLAQEIGGQKAADELQKIKIDVYCYENRKRCD